MLLIAAVAIVTATPSSAQTDLAIIQVMESSFKDDPSATRTLIKGGRLEKYDLSLYHGVTIENREAVVAEIEPIVLKDATKAVSREVNYRNGHLYYGFFRFKRRKSGTNRYLFYLNDYLKGGNKLILIYMEGFATPDEIKKMLK